MNAVEIEEAMFHLTQQPFDAESFPYSFLEAFGNKETTIKRLKGGSTNASDIGGVLQRNNVHIAVCEDGEISKTLVALKNSPATTKAKAKFILATDGQNLEAEDLISGETITCRYADFPNSFGFFLPLAGITTTKQIRDNPIDIKATGRLNNLYIELLKTNEEWASDERRHDMNQFMARLIFCFFAEDTDIFNGKNLFTSTIEQMSGSRSGNTDFVIGELFRAMDTKRKDRSAANLPRWADAFPYVNGCLFTGSKEIPKFSRIARSYLLHAGNLDWQKINPDIFGSMIQAVADDDERGELGMHYTSVPNILKALNPLFLDDLNEQLGRAGNNHRKLLNLRKRLSMIRVFDPACGSGNFLVIAYIRMREIEAKIVRIRRDTDQRSWIKLHNFFGIELKDFAAEIARLSLLIAEFQCDVKFIGQKEAKELVLPLKHSGHIRQGNALHLNWLEVCPGTLPNDMPKTELNVDQQSSETYVCGNPPYTGYNRQSESQKADIKNALGNKLRKYGMLDYVSCWFVKAADLNSAFGYSTAFVSTNSICQGNQVPQLWGYLFEHQQEIFFARTSFKWQNLAANNAGITVVVVGIQNKSTKAAKLYQEDFDGQKWVINERKVHTIGPYLIPNSTAIVAPRNKPISGLPEMILGNHPYYGAPLIMTRNESRELLANEPEAKKFIRSYYGSSETIKGTPRSCIWITDKTYKDAEKTEAISAIFEAVRKERLSKKKDKTSQSLADYPHRFRDQRVAERSIIVVPQVSSERRSYLPVSLLQGEAIISFQAYGVFDGPLWALAVICSKLHWNWISRICRRMRTDYSYSNTLGWNTFPVPPLTERNKADLTLCAENILVARELHFPATISDLYDPEGMPDDLRSAHERNDEVLERIYIGRRFKNDSERLEKLFDLYTTMSADTSPTTS